MIFEGFRGLAVAFAAVAAAVLLVVFGIFVWQRFEGGLISQHTLNVRHSIGYVDAQNSHCEQVSIPDYSAAKASFDRDAGNAQAQRDDRAQMAAAVTDCRTTVGQLSPGEVAAPVAQFLAEHP
jgi:hypothetical protein